VHQLPLPAHHDYFGLGEGLNRVFAVGRDFITFPPAIHNSFTTSCHTAWKSQEFVRLADAGNDGKD
jgi:hypothetical protein